MNIVATHVKVTNVDTECIHAAYGHHFANL